MFACAVQCMFGQLEREGTKKNEHCVAYRPEKNRKKERKRIDQKMTMSEREREWAVRST
jgi:hypothetical protein